MASRAQALGTAYGYVGEPVGERGVAHDPARVIAPAQERPAVAQRAAGSGSEVEIKVDLGACWVAVLQVDVIEEKVVPAVSLVRARSVRGEADLLVRG